MPDLTLEQALADHAPGGVTIVARSPAFTDEWAAEFLRLCAAFGQPGPGEFLPTCVFARPLARGTVAVVHAAAEGSPPVLRFHCLAVPADLYAAVGDPFLVAEQFPPPWGEKVALPTLAWLDEVPVRTVAQVQRVLQEDDAPTLLGAAQALVDGGRVVFERPFPAPDLLHRLWLLLPDSTRAEVWPASYAYGPDLGVQAVVVPKADPAAFPGYMTEEQAGDYPEGRYELNLQIAAEAGDQAALDRLFARRSGRQTLQLALVLLAVITGLAVAARLLGVRIVIEMPADESVLVISADALDGLGLARGFRADLGDRLADLLDPAHVTFRPRSAVETDPSVKQLIPYIVLRCGGDLFHYTRGAGGGEARLRAKRSVGVGGHITAADAAGATDPYRTGMLRELAEEVQVDTPFTEQVLGLVYDPSTPVGEVHMGVVHLLTLDRPAVRPLEADLTNAGFAPLTELWEQRAAFESWSQFVLEALHRPG